MRKRLSLVLVVGVCGYLSALAQAQSAGPSRQKVIDALTAVAGGSCPERLMNATLLDACEQQLERMQAALQRLGSIKEARYRGKEPLPNGVEAEVYRVVFENGQMTWIAALGPNGKLSLLLSQG
jgi:hypothetical protein